MSRTKAQIVDRSLRMLGKLAIGANSKGAQADDMGLAYDQVYAELESAGLMSWDADSVPDEFVESVAALCAAERAEGLSGERYQRIITRASRSKLDISAKIAGKWNNSRKATNY